MACMDLKNDRHDWPLQDDGYFKIYIYSNTRVVTKLVYFSPILKEHVGQPKLSKEDGFLFS